MAALMESHVALLVFAANSHPEHHRHVSPLAREFQAPSFYPTKT